MLIDILNAESLLLRIEKQSELNIKQEHRPLQEAVMKVFFHDINARMAKNALDALASFCEGDLLKTLAMGVKRFTKYPLVNVKANRRLIANLTLQVNQYPISYV
jgi:hypothetical protein